MTIIPTKPDGDVRIVWYLMSTSGPACSGFLTAWTACKAAALGRAGLSLTLGSEVARPPGLGLVVAQLPGAQVRTSGFGPSLSAACGMSTASIAAITMP